MFDMEGMMMTAVRTKDLLENFNLTLVAGFDGVHREITTSDISRPGIEMTGYFKYYLRERLQLIGKTEMAYFLDLTDEERKDRADQLCNDITTGNVVSRGMDIHEDLMKAEKVCGISSLKSTRTTINV